MRGHVVIWALGAVALSWSCRSVPPRSGRAAYHPVEVEAHSDRIEPDAPVRGLRSSARGPDARSTGDEGRAVPAQGDAVPIEGWNQARASEPRLAQGRPRPEPTKADGEVVRDGGRGPRRYALNSGRGDGPVHLEVLDRPPDEPRLRLDPSLPRRFQDYSEPPAEILNRLRIIHCVPCPRR